MKLSTVDIEHFRSIKKCHVRLNEITTIIGENNAGKTALLRALNSVFNWGQEKNFFEDNTHQYMIRTVSKILLTFEDIPNKSIYTDKLYNNKLVLGFSYSYSMSRRGRTLFCVTNNGNKLVEDSFIEELKQDIDYIYIPAQRGNDDLIWKEDSIFQKVLVAYSQYYTQFRDSASAQIGRVGKNLKNSIFSKIEREFESMSMLDTNEHYVFDYVENLDYSIFLSKMGIQIKDSGKSYPVTEYGSGIKSLSVIALYRALAKNKNVNVILGLEEPEINLHPHAQKKLIASIKNKRQQMEVQAIMATHSTVIVDELEHEDVILARRIPDVNRGFHTEFTQIEDDFWNKYNLNEFKHNKFFKYKNSDFFFAKYIIIVESSTDAEVIHKLINDVLGEKSYYVSFLNLDGIKNLKYPYFLLKSLGFDFSMVVDMDFLTQYKNDSLDASRDSSSFLPQYKNIVNSRNSVINDLWPQDSDKQLVTNALAQSYSKVFDVCKIKKLFPMQYCLEMDLVAKRESRSKYCDIMGISEDADSNRKLLIDKKDAIKDPEKILSVVSDLKPANYPYSYKKIRKAICNDINSSF